MKLLRIKTKPAANKAILTIPVCSKPREVLTNREIITRYTEKPKR